MCAAPASWTLSQVSAQSARRQRGTAQRIALAGRRRRERRACETDVHRHFRICVSWQYGPSRGCQGARAICTDTGVSGVPVASRTSARDADADVSACEGIRGDDIRGLLSIVSPLPPRSRVLPAGCFRGRVYGMSIASRPTPLPGCLVRLAQYHYRAYSDARHADLGAAQSYNATRCSPPQLRALYSPCQRTSRTAARTQYRGARLY